MKHIIQNFIRNIVFLRFSLVMEKREKSILNIRNMPTCKVEGEDEWIKFWRPLVKTKNKFAYRLYSQSCGNSKFIISEPACIAINNALNPVEFQAYYADKNMFDRLLSSGATPRTILRKMKGDILFDKEYHPVKSFSESSLTEYLKGFDSVILKPSIGTNSGIGVELFIRNRDNKFYQKNSNDLLTADYLLTHPDEFILQEAMHQHPFMANLNPSSINTIRLATYRSIKDNEVHLLSSVIRIGAKDQFVDNLHAGGVMIRVLENGELDKCCYTQEGTKLDSHNNISFKDGNYLVPQWDKIISFAKENASRLTHMRLIQHDIMIDENGNPKYIEFNNIGFSQWIAQFTGTPAFLNFAEEMRDYALKSLPSTKTIII